MVMGLAGLTIAWQKAQHIFAVDLSINIYLITFTAGVFIVLLTMYAAKYVMSYETVLSEFKNPIKLHFFPTISISMLLLSIAFLQFNHDISFAIWVMGSAVHLMFTLYIINAWIHHEHFEVQHLNPAWFIPAVGNVIVPITGVQLGFIEISWFFFSIGMLFWVILLTIIFNRVMFHNPMQDKLVPTLFILIAPPAVGFISYTKLNGDLDSFARILYFSGLFLTMLMLVQIKRFAKLKFFLSWWAYSFPLAAITIASFRMYDLTQKLAYQYIAAGLLILLTVVVIFLIYKTAMAIKNHNICVEEH
jgi:tellurite resistance protein